MGLLTTLLGSKSSQQNSSKSSLIETNNILGFIHNDKPVVSSSNLSFCLRRKNSIMDSIDTGFGETNVIVKDCPKPLYKIPLYKENYLGEFKGETEKAKARENLGVYGKEEVNKIIANIISNDTSTFVTKKEVSEMLEDLDFVSSTLRAYAYYNIPNNLFLL